MPDAHSAAPRRTSLLAPLLAPLLALALLATPLIAQGDPQSDGLSREEMWRAPTAEDWAKPVLITWQRTWEDAVAVSEATGRPILACINMDGEIASEHYAGVRYRQPEVAELMEPYVTVIASVYRHTPRDFDASGERIECPRFGGVTCGEHIALEPILYEKYLDGQRIAPRHVMIELDGSEVYDKYFAYDTASVFARIRRGIEEREPVPIREPDSDRPLVERVASPFVSDREAVERAYREGDAAQRRMLIQAASRHGADVPVDLLRLAIFGIDVELASTARDALTQSDSPKAVDLLNNALAEPLPPAERDALVSALARLGERSDKARSLATVHRGLSGRDGSPVDPGAWAAAAGAGASYAADAEGAPQRERERVTLLERQDEVLGSDDPGALLALAESFLALASEQPADQGEYARFLFMDAERAARRARELGADDWRVDTALATSAWYLGRAGEARALATRAVEAGIPPDQQGWHTMVALALFAQERQEAIRAALRAGGDWPPAWLADVNAACEVLLQHPHGTVEQALAYHDFLRALRAEGQAWAVARAALERWPAAPEVHERIRRGLLLDQGHEALEPFYARRLARDDAPAVLHRFAGAAAQQVAEFERRRGNEPAAVAAYERALAHFEADREAHPDHPAPAEHRIVLVRGGLARLALERGELPAALAQLQVAFAVRPESAASQDGLNLTAVDTAKMLRARLAELGDEQRLEQLDAALAELAAVNPALLDLPAYEKNLPPVPDDT